MEGSQACKCIGYKWKYFVPYIYREQFSSSIVFNVLTRQLTCRCYLQCSVRVYRLVMMWRMELAAHKKCNPTLHKCSMMWYVHCSCMMIIN